VRLRTVSALAVLAVVLLYAATPAFAANEVAYQCDTDICLLDPANPGAVTNLTDNGSASFDEKPIWSPDGNKVAFISDFTQTGHGEKNVFVMEPGAADQAVNLATQITSYSSGAKVIAELAWSPDGSRIAYTRGNNSGDDSVWVVNADGTTIFPLEIGGSGAKRHPTWSPDSSKIAYAVVKNAPEQIYVAPSSGGFGQPLPNGVGHEPNWSPDGSRIAFDGYPSGKNFGYVDLHVVLADGSGTPLLVTPGTATEWTFNAWSPDGGRIAYRATDSGGTIYRVMNAGGGGDHPLASPGEGDARFASFSPDGSRVIYEGALISDINVRNLYVASSDGSGAAQPLTSDGKSQYPAWRVVRNTPQVPPPHPGAKKPKVVWITKRIPWTPGRPIYVASYGCGGPRCSVATEGKMKGSMAAGIIFRPGVGAARAKPKGKKKPRLVLVGRSKTKIPAGATRRIKFRLNRTGAAVLKKRGKATIKVTLTAKIAGQAKKVVRTHSIRVYLKKANKPKH
jgi:Tol biopolymer transport system component